MVPYSLILDRRKIYVSRPASMYQVSKFSPNVVGGHDISPGLRQNRRYPADPGNGGLRKLSEYSHNFGEADLGPGTPAVVRTRAQPAVLTLVIGLVTAHVHLHPDLANMDGFAVSGCCSRIAVSCRDRGPASYPSRAASTPRWDPRNSLVAGEVDREFRRQARRGPMALPKSLLCVRARHACDCPVRWHLADRHRRITSSSTARSIGAFRDVDGAAPTRAPDAPGRSRRSRRIKISVDELAFEDFSE
jgi:hypothetical protein